jgi:hypothetical protein
MRKFIYIANAALTLPFGVAALIAPATVFAGFGLSLDAGGELIARGYAAACLGYGWLFWMLRKTNEPAATRALLSAAVIFNLVETLIQGAAALGGGVLPAIWGTVGAHAVMTALCLYALFAKTPA